MDMVKRYVALGMGVSVGPRLAIEPDDHRDLGVVSLLHILPTEQGGVITLKGRPAIHARAALSVHHAGNSGF